MTTVVLSVEGMMCMHCVAHVDKALKAVAGVTDVKVDLQSAHATVTGEAPVEALIAAVKEAGYVAKTA